MVAFLPLKAWRRLAVSEGKRDPAQHNRAQVRDVQSGEACLVKGGLLASRSSAHQTDVASHLSYAPSTVSLHRMAEHSVRKVMLILELALPLHALPATRSSLARNRIQGSRSPWVRLYDHSEHRQRGDYGYGFP